MIEFACKTLAETAAAAKYFANLAKPGSCFLLNGDLGSGKTTFSKYFIQSINPLIIDVSSPTFNIVHTYSSDIAQILHLDCYRLKNSEEFWELGMDEALSDSISLIEWPEIIKNFLPSITFNLFFQYSDDIYYISCKN